MHCSPGTQRSVRVANNVAGYTNCYAAWFAVLFAEAYTCVRDLYAWIAIEFNFFPYIPDEDSDNQRPANHQSAKQSIMNWTGNKAAKKGSLGTHQASAAGSARGCLAGYILSSNTMAKKWYQAFTRVWSFMRSVAGCRQ